jgi:hypothetical protein
MSTLAKVLDDNTSLMDWKAAQVGIGVAMRPDLRATFASHKWDEDGRKVLKQASESAVDAAGGTSGRNLGTAMHKFVQRVHDGEALSIVPAEWRPDAEAILRALERAKLDPLPEWQETLVVTRELSAAGSYDGAFRCRVTGDTFIGDLKTGKQEDTHGHVRCGIQFSGYARGVPWRDGKYVDPLGVDLDQALMIHAPIGTGTCRILPVDIRAGWRLALLAHKAHQERKTKAVISQQEYRPAEFASLTPAQIEALPSVEAVREVASRSGQPWTTEHVKAARAVRDRLAFAPDLGESAHDLLTR